MKDESFPDSTRPHFHKMCFECGTEIVSFREYDCFSGSYTAQETTYFMRNIFNPVEFMGQMFKEHFEPVQPAAKQKSFFQIIHCVVCEHETRSFIKRPSSEKTTSLQVHLLDIKGQVHLLDIKGYAYLYAEVVPQSKDENKYIYDHGLPRNWIALPDAIFDWEEDEVEVLDGSNIDMALYFEQLGYDFVDD